MFGLVFQSILTTKIIVPTFEKNGGFKLGVVFLFSHFSPIEKIVFNKNCLYPIEDNDFLSANFKEYFTSDHFLLSSGGLKIAKFVKFWTILCVL